MTLPFRTAGNTDLVSLDQLVAAFGLTLAEDTAVGGLTVYVFLGSSRELFATLPATVEAYREWADGHPS